jgi:hypothetical protein
MIGQGVTDRSFSGSLIQGRVIPIYGEGDVKLRGNMDFTIVDSRG